MLLLCFCFLFFAGTNEATITEVLAHRTIAQRQRIKEAYKQTVGKVRVFFTLLYSQAANKVNKDVGVFFYHKSQHMKHRKL